MKRNLFYIIISFIIAALILGVVLNFNNENHNMAKKGVLNLKDYDFAKNGPIKLDGEWEFVPDKLVDSSYFVEGRAPNYVNVPSLWNRYMVNHQPVPKYTSATYRLIVKPPSNKHLLGIRKSNIRMSNTIYINGDKIGGSGVPGEKENYKPHNTPYISFFYNDRDQIEIIVHVSNYHYASGGGIVSSLYLGDEKSILKLRQNAVMYDWVTVASFLMVGIYFLGFYLHFRKDRSLFYFSLFCFSVVLYSLTHGEKLLLSLFPYLPYETFAKLQGSSNLIALFLLIYFHTILNQYSNKKLVQVLNTFGILLTLFTLFPIRIFSQFQLLFSAYFLINVFYVLFIQIKATINKTTGAYYLFIGSITLTLYFIVGTLNVMGNFEVDILPPILPFVYLLMLSLFMAQRFTVTYRKNEELTEQLIKVDKFKDEFLAKTSHEFRTPLHGIIAVLQTMLSNQNRILTTQQEEKVNFVIMTAKRLSSLINDILDLAKLKRNELRLEIKSTDLYSTVYLVIEAFTYMLPQNIKIINLIPRDIPFVQADENRLRQILYNLIDNAIKYTYRGTIQIMAEVQSNEIIISVKDTGIGIDTDNLEKIFHAYQRLGSAGPESDGLGLGLNIVKELVELQDGQMWVTSIKGQGSTFSFSLPVVKHEAQYINQPVNELVNEPYGVKERIPHFAFPFIYGNPNGKKIIIADDNHYNLSILIEALKSEDYYIIAVDNGHDVLAQLEQFYEIDLILLDIMMPKMSGFEVCKKIREKYSMTDLPILMLTAAIREEDLEASFKAGANDFLHKPIDLTELKTRMKNLILMKETASSATSIEAAYLQTQIKPHFIYNVLNSIMSLSYLDIGKSRELIANFATFLRGSFVFTNTDKLIPIHNEISLVQSYVEIEKARFPEKFDIKIDIDIELNCMIPPLLIQPLVENAIRHGISGRKNGGQVALSISKNEGYITIKVMDNGAGISQEKINQIHNLIHHENSGVGIINIVKRIKNYSGSTFTIESEEQKGTTITVIFPWMEANVKEDGYVKGAPNR